MRTSAQRVEAAAEYAALQQERGELLAVLVVTSRDEQDEVLAEIEAIEEESHRLLEAF